MAKQSLWDQVPAPADPRLPQSSPALGPLRTLENVSIGGGYGMTNQLSGWLGMALHPRDTANALYNLARTPPNQLAMMAKEGLQNTARNAMSGPLGFGEFLGNNLSPRTLLPGAKVMREATAYHGSPHDFDQFSMEKIGTGEGAQAYGHGLYFAENPKVAGGYRQRLSPTQEIRVDGQVFDANNAAHQAADIVRRFPTPASAARQARETSKMARQMGQAENAAIYESAARLIESGAVKPSELVKGGNLYTVDIPDADIERMLDWDAPLSQQPAAVRQALKDAGVVNFADNIGPSATGDVRPFGWTRNVDSLTGEELYRRLIEQKFTGKPATSAARKASEAEASAMLGQMGIPGIRYLDGGSRTAGKGTRNFVVFDDKLVKVTGKE